MPQESDNVPWIVIPLGPTQKMTIRDWMARAAPSAAADKALEVESTKYLKAAFERFGLVYDEQGRGPIAVETLRFWNGQEGVAVPESHFISPDDQLTRVSLPLNE